MYLHVKIISRKEMLGTAHRFFFKVTQTIASSHFPDVDFALRIGAVRAEQRAISPSLAATVPT